MSIFGYQILQKIDGGATSQVYFARHIQSKKYYAIKFVSKSHISNNLCSTNKNLEYAQAEIKILRKCNSSHILKIIDVFYYNNQLALVLEYCNRGNLFSYLKENNNRLNQSRSIYFIKQLIEGLKELYRINCVHRDLKLQNILLHNNLVKIADFGCSKLLQNKFDSSSTFIGNTATMSPKRKNGEDYGLNQNIYAIGNILHFMLYGKYPSSNKNVYLEDQNISQRTRQFLIRCLKEEEWQRMSYQQLFNYNFQQQDLKIIPFYILDYKKNQKQVICDLKSVYNEQIERKQNPQSERIKNNNGLYLWINLANNYGRYLEQLQNITYGIEYLDDSMQYIKNNIKNVMQKCERFSGCFVQIGLNSIRQLRIYQQNVKNNKNCWCIDSQQFNELIKNKGLIGSIQKRIKDKIRSIMNLLIKYKTICYDQIIIDRQWDVYKKKQYETILGNAQAQLTNLLQIKIDYNCKIQILLIKYIIILFIKNQKKTKNQLIQRLNIYGSYQIDFFLQFLNNKKKVQITRLY